MPLPVSEAGNPTLITASAVIRTGPWQAIGLFVSSLGSGGIELYDAVTSGSGTVLPVLTFNTGTYYPLPMSGKTGITARVSGTCSAVLMWNPLGGS